MRCWRVLEAAAAAWRCRDDTWPRRRGAARSLAEDPPACPWDACKRRIEDRSARLEAILARCGTRCSARYDADQQRFQCLGCDSRRAGLSHASASTTRWDCCVLARMTSRKERLLMGIFVVFVTTKYRCVPLPVCSVHLVIPIHDGFTSIASSRRRAFVPGNGNHWLCGGLRCEGAARKGLPRPRHRAGLGRAAAVRSPHGPRCGR